MADFNHLDFTEISKLSELKDLLAVHHCELALIKKLPKNNNDKNQLYFHHDASILNSVFDLTFSERIESTSTTKRSSKPGKFIPQAVFNEFCWVSKNGTTHKAKECKAIVYHQYPEARLSGFQTIDGQMPRAMSIEYTKTPNLLPRYFVLGATPSGTAIALMIVGPSVQFQNEFLNLPNFSDSKICKHLVIKDRSTGTEKLKAILESKVAGKILKGCRFNKEGKTIPFTGTQVHGYTLEHACGIKPNSDKNGDIFGIELKCFTNKKLTLFTPEPDGGLYSKSFAEFMKKYGYYKEGDYRVTGLHRANIISKKSQLTLRISYLPIDKEGLAEKRAHYSPDIPFSKQLNEMRVELEDKNNDIAASWSVERLLNCWGAKHNEVVYCPATVTDNDNKTEIEQGYLKKVSFSNNFLWCKYTTFEKLIRSINDGFIFLDPAPKYNENDKSRNKRRSQWRVNDIHRESTSLYKNIEVVEFPLVD